jgi:uncharacterized protein DUF5654
MEEKPTTRDGPASSPVADVGQRASRLSREFVATTLSVVTTALGVVIALAWNTALTTYFAEVFGTTTQVVALFVYALAITAVGVFAIIALGKLAHRLDADPVEFKYPVKAKDED